MADLEHAYDRILSVDGVDGADIRDIFGEIIPFKVTVTEEDGPCTKLADQILAMRREADETLKNLGCQLDALISEKDAITTAFSDLRHALHDVLPRTIPIPDDLLELQNTYETRMKAVVDTCLVEKDAVIAALRPKVDDARRTVQSVKTDLTKMMKMVTGKDDTTMATCNFCYASNIRECFVPCGHTACTACTTRIRTGSCPVCRSTIRQTMRIYV